MVVPRVLILEPVVLNAFIQASGNHKITKNIYKSCRKPLTCTQAVSVCPLKLRLHLEIRKSGRSELYLASPAGQFGNTPKSLLPTTASIEKHYSVEFSPCHDKYLPMGQIFSQCCKLARQQRLNASVHSTTAP